MDSLSSIAIGSTGTLVSLMDKEMEALRLVAAGKAEMLENLRTGTRDESLVLTVPWYEPAAGIDQDSESTAESSRASKVPESLPSPTVIGTPSTKRGLPRAHQDLSDTIIRSHADGTQVPPSPSGGNPQELGSSASEGGRNGKSTIIWKENLCMLFKGATLGSRYTSMRKQRGERGGRRKVSRGAAQESGMLSFLRKEERKGGTKISSRKAKKAVMDEGELVVSSRLISSNPDEQDMKRPRPWISSNVKETRRTLSHVEIVDFKCCLGNATSDKPITSSISNRYKKMSFMRLSDSSPLEDGP